MTDNLRTLAEQVGAQLLARQQRLTLAESCTGGWIAKVCTDIVGSSGWFECGFVTYSNEAKQRLLGVAADTLQASGAVSEQTVREMVLGAIDRSTAEWAAAVSGIAGPGGGSEDKPVGTVCFAWAGPDGWLETLQLHFSGDRESVRRQSVQHSLSFLYNKLHGISK